jgi:hypothetical protein
VVAVAQVLEQRKSFSVGALVVTGRFLMGLLVVAGRNLRPHVFGAHARVFGAHVRARWRKPPKHFFGAQVVAGPFWTEPPFCSAPFWELSPAWAAKAIPNMATTEAATETMMRLMVDSSSV